MSTKKKKVLSLFLALVMVFSLLPGAAFATQDDTSEQAASDPFMKIVFLDCGRKYFSVGSIKKIIDNAAAAGFNYIQLAVGNDGLRFLLNDMSLTVNGTTYTSKQVSDAIHAGNEAYYNFTTDELTQSEMDTIIAYAKDKGLGVIPCVNTPGHMDAILSAANSLTGTTCSYNGSARTIDVTNDTAVAFTQALLQKYITYFAGKGCEYFNMGADEYANDKFTTGSMGFGQLQSEGEYGSYVNYVNQVATLIKAAKMTPMAFNDGIYFANNTSSGTFDTDIVICYWSNGWSGYTPMPAADLAAKGFKLVNTHGDYYWVLGKSDWQCNDKKASGFTYTSFPAKSGQNGTISNPAGAMFCIWCDYPGADTEANVISSTAATITAFGETLPTESKTVEDTTTSVSVTAPGLASVTVGQLTGNSVPTIAGASTDKIVAYSIEPKTASGDSYTSEATVTLPIPEGWDTSKIRGYVEASNGQAAAVGITGEAKDGYFTFTVPHFSVVAIYETAAAATEGETTTETKTEENITLTVGETEKRVLSGDLRNNVKNSNDAVASASATYDGNTSQTTTTRGNKVTSFTGTSATGVISDGTNYLVVDSSGDISSTTDISAATKFTVKKGTSGGAKYTIQVSGGSYYLAVSDSKLTTTTTTSSSGDGRSNGTNWTFDETNGFYRSEKGSDKANYYLYYNDGGWSVETSTSSSNAGFLYEVTETTTTGPATTITFTGLKAGGTNVTVGDVTYHITVTVADLSKVTPITVEYWITNREVTAEGAKYKTISASATGVYSESGALFSALVPGTGTGGDASSAVVFWKGTRLTSTTKQTTGFGVDRTTSGDDFTYVRYWGGNWSFSADGSKWENFDSSNQIVAYYLQKTTVTKEVETQVVDWGVVPYSNYSSTSFVLIDYAVKYENGTTTPTTFPQSTTTQAFHCNTGKDDLNKTVFADGKTFYRKIGMIRAQETDDYEVYMITLTPSSDTTTTTLGNSVQNVSSYTYQGTEKVVWVDAEANLGEFAAAEKRCTGFTVGGDPIVKQLKIYKNQGLLITYYVRAKATEDSLTVNYIDEANKSTQFYSYNIAVVKGTTFDESICLKTGDKWKGDLENGNVTNKQNVTQTVSADLSTMPAIAAQYRYVDYKCTKVVRSEDGKTVNLYYTFDSTKTFVVDYGLPITIKPKDVNAELGNNGVTINDVTVTPTSRETYAYGGVVTGSSGNFTYTPNKIMTGSEQLSVTYTGTIPVTVENGKTTCQPGAVTYTITILPASTMYYEESPFVTFTAGSGLSDATWSQQTSGTPTTASQVLSALGDKARYGYDEAYESMTQYSMNTAQKVTVTSGMTGSFSTSTAATWPTATFTFKGTGFDVISLTNNTSGAIFVRVYEGSGTSGVKVRDTMVDNYYGYTYDSETKTWTVNKDASDTLYQIPVMKISGLEYKEYTAVITVAYSDFFDDANAKQYSFTLDAIRIYDPMGPDYSAYTRDDEGYPVYTNLHKALTSNTATMKPAVFIDGKNEANLAEYTNYGPNNEIYLKYGQAISFKLTGDLSKIASVQIGAKAPQGTAATMVVGTDTNGGTTISTATDMYYDITSAAVSNGAANTVTILNTSTGILSLTNLKITFTTSGESVTLGTMTDTDTANALMVVRSVFAAEAPVIEPFVPERFEAKWDRSVRAGQRATLTVKTSEDVAAITVDGQTIDTYRTYTERSGRGWNATRVTYRVFTYTVTPTETTDYTVSALSSDGAASTPITATLTVTTQRASGWWGRWS